MHNDSQRRRSQRQSFTVSSERSTFGRAIVRDRIGSRDTDTMMNVASAATEAISMSQGRSVPNSVATAATANQQPVSSNASFAVRRDHGIHRRNISASHPKTGRWTTQTPKALRDESR
jgi:hypothetical protein